MDHKDERADQIGCVLESMQEEGGGFFDLHLYMPDQISSIFSALEESGKMPTDFHTLVLLSGLRKMSPAALAKRPEHRPMCLTCTTPFSETVGPICMLVLTARCEDPKNAVANGICGKCAVRLGDEESIISAAFAVYKEQIAPDARRVSGPPVNAVGHA